MYRFRNELIPLLIRIYGRIGYFLISFIIRLRINEYQLRNQYQADDHYDQPRILFHGAVVIDELQ